MRQLALVALAFAGVGCNAPYLTWTPREPLAARRGRVEVAVDDHRARPGELGAAYGFGGTPVVVRVRDDEPRERLQRLATEALYTAGLSPSSSAPVALPTPPTARLSLGLDALTCDGSHMKARATLTLTWAVLAPDGAARLAPQQLALTGKGHGCEAAFHDALDQLLDELAAALVEGPAHDAALGLGQST